MSSPGRVTPTRLVDACLLALFAGGFVLLSMIGVVHGSWGYDAFAYWSVDLAHPYDHAVGAYGAFLYAPPAAQVSGLFGLLPWEVFLTAWTILLVGALAWLGRGRAAILFLIPFVALEILSGNIQILLAVAIVLGLRWPAAWAFVLLTKVTPGIGLLWFVARREWRSLSVALGATVVIGAVSFLLAPGMWSEWTRWLLEESQRSELGPWTALSGPLWLRLIIAAAIVVGAGLLGWRWPLAVAATLALPNPSPQSLSLLVALVPLVALDRARPLARMGLPGRAGVRFRTGVAIP